MQSRGFDMIQYLLMEPDVLLEASRVSTGFYPFSTVQRVGNTNVGGKKGCIYMAKKSCIKKKACTLSIKKIIIIRDAPRFFFFFLTKSPPKTKIFMQVKNSKNTTFLYSEIIKHNTATIFVNAT